MQPAAARSLLLAPGILALSTLLSIVATISAQTPTGKPTSDEVLRDALQSAGLETPLRGELQRPIDPRLIRIETEGIEQCGLFPGRIHVAHNAAAVRALSGKLSPGDQLVLAGNDWRDARFTFGGQGTLDAPILIRPERTGGVVFTGDSEVAFFGSHLIIMELEFQRTTISRDGTVVFRLGNGKMQPAAQCIVNRIRIEDCNSPNPDDWPKMKTWYLTADHGRDNTVANSTFSGLRHLGQMLGAAELPREGLQRLHILNNRFSDRPFLDSQNGYEIVQIGWSQMLARPAGSLIQGNRFENCNGENEIVTLKASDIFVRDNQFLDCQGVLCLRAANRVLVQGNLFEGKGRPDAGGVRLQGAGHVLIGNTFRELRQPRSYYSWPVSLMAASCENYGDQGDVGGYGRAKEILITRNRFERCDARIAVGIYPRPEYPLLPRNIFVQDNVFRDTSATSPFDYVAPDPSGALPTEIHASGNEFFP